MEKCLKNENYDISADVYNWFNDYCNNVLDKDKKFGWKDLKEDLEDTDISIYVDECIIDLAAQYEWPLDEMEEYRGQIEYDLDKLVEDALNYIEYGNYDDSFNKNNADWVSRYSDNVAYTASLESRVRKLERSLKREFLGVFNKPKRSDEKDWVTKLFNKYPSMKKIFDVNDQIDASSEKKPFHLILTTRDDDYDGMSFIISTKGDRNNMYCTAFDKNNMKVAGLKQFNLDKELNQCAMFILKTLQDNEKNEQRNRYNKHKYENVPLTTFDCEALKQIIEDNFDDLPEIEIDIVDDNSDYGFINVGIYSNDKIITSYDIIVDNVNSVSIEHDNKNIGTAKSLEEAADVLADHFMEDYINGKYNNKEKK